MSAEKRRKWDEGVKKLEEKDEPWSELICKIDPANVDGRYHKCIGPKCGHWNRNAKMCGFAMACSVSFSGGKK